MFVDLGEVDSNNQEYTSIAETPSRAQLRLHLQLNKLHHVNIANTLQARHSYPEQEIYPDHHIHIRAGILAEKKRNREQQRGPVDLLPPMDIGQPG